MSEETQKIIEEIASIKLRLDKLGMPGVMVWGERWDEFKKAMKELGHTIRGKKFEYDDITHLKEEK